MLTEIAENTIPIKINKLLFLKTWHKFGFNKNDTFSFLLGLVNLKGDWKADKYKPIFTTMAASAT